MEGVVLALRIIKELTELVTRALRENGNVTREDIAAAFDRADEAESNWLNTLEGTGDGHGDQTA